MVAALQFGTKGDDCAWSAGSDLELDMVLAGANVQNTKDACYAAEIVRPVEHCHPGWSLPPREFARRFIIKGKNLAANFFGCQSPAALARWMFGLSRLPDALGAMRFLVELVCGARKDFRTGLVILAIRRIEPDLAEKWANKLVAPLNNAMRERAPGEASVHVEYPQAEVILFRCMI